MNKEEIIAKSDFIITFGSMLADNKEAIRNKIIESIAKTDANLVYMHPIDNIDIKLYYTQFIKYEVGSEEGICALLLSTFVKECDENIKTYIESLDLGYISAESSAGEEEFEEAYEESQNCQFKTLVVGDDLCEHESLDNIVKMLAIFKKFTDFNVIVLSDDLNEKIDSCEDTNIDEIKELKSYDGTVLYRLIDEEDNDKLICSKAFANIAKVNNEDKVNILFKDEKVQRVINIDEKLSGTISLAKTTSSNEEVFKDYRYKQVRIQRLDD